MTAIQQSKNNLEIPLPEGQQYLQFPSFELECGETLPVLDIAYFTYGTLSPKKDNVIWVCHALTGNADAADWWNGLIGKEKLFDPTKHFIVCANMMGSCYGATNAKSINPTTGEKYMGSFPNITIRDMVRSHQILRKHLGIEQVHLVLGGSMGGQQALEWSIMEPDLFKHSCIIAANAQHSPWGIAFNEAQRMAIEADPTLYHHTTDAGRAGLEAARAIAMLSYRNYQTYTRTQQDKENNKLEYYRASSYQRYQGLKLSRRFHALSYLSLSKAMDSHHIGRNRGSIENALQKITAKTLVIGIQSDILFPINEQALIAKHTPNATLEIIDSPYGHDGFLIENEALTKCIRNFCKLD